MNDSMDEFKKIVDSSDYIFRSLGFFSGNEKVSFIFKKTEKITQGLYIATNHIKDADTLKWLIRERAVDMLYISIQMSSFKNIKSDILEEDFLTIAFEITSLLNIASRSYIISQNNSSILIGEIGLLVGQIKEGINQRTTYGKSLFLTEDFFKVDKTVDGPNGSINTFSSRKDTITKNNSVLGIKKIQENGLGTSVLKDRKNSRQEQILELLKKQNSLTIKDFVKVITNCSEKTIQRELILLTRNGLIVKEGERRWSKYSLKNIH